MVHLDGRNTLSGYIKKVNLILALRRRLDLGGRQFAKLVGANRHTVSSRESGKSEPQNEHRVKIVAFRGIGKTKAKKLLDLWTPAMETQLPSLGGRYYCTPNMMEDVL